MSGVDRAIRVSTAIVVLGVACVAAYVSYWHAYEVVRAHGETGTTARLVPATVDGLVYASSMVLLYAARHRLAVPALARGLLAVGILATLAANIAHGWSYGPVGAAVAAWPAVALVGSYELLMWMVRTAAASAMAREPADRAGGPAIRSTGLQPAPANTPGRANGFRDSATTDPQRLHPTNHVPLGGPPNGPASDKAEPVGRSADQTVVDRPTSGGPAHRGDNADDDADAAATAAYRASIQAGKPLSERKLARMFGKTSRRWARNRMAEAKRTLDTVA